MISARHCLSFAPVLFKLIIPLKLLRFIVVLSLLLWPLGFLLESQFGWQWIQIPAAIGGFVVLLGAVFILPGQVTTLASSRPVSLLSNLRQLLLWFVVISSLLLSLALYWAFSFSPWSADFPSLLLVIWLLVSWMLQLCVWLCSRWNGSQGFIFLLNLLLDDLARWLSDFNPVMLVALLFASWVLFSQWWFRWRPKKYQPNLYLLGSSEAQKLQLERQGGSPWFTGYASSWIGSRLSGVPDSWQSFSKRMLATGCLLLAGTVPSYFIMNTEQLQALILNCSRFFVILAGVFALGVATSFYRNLRAIWLFTSGGRAQLFHLVWRSYWRTTMPLTILLSGVALVVELVLGEWRGSSDWLQVLCAILLFQALLFHLIWLVYQKTNASLLWCNWVSLILLVIWMCTIFAAGLIFPLPFGWQEISTLWVIIPEVIVLALIYKRVRSGFTTINFLRAV